MHLRADAFQEYTQAAIVDRMISALPQIAEAMAQSLNKVDKITIVSSGNGSGASSLTGEVARMVAQVPAVIEGITGMKVGDMVDRLRGIPAGNGAVATSSNDLTAATKPTSDESK
jgi:flotillin